MMKIIYTRSDGGLSVIHPVVNTGETLTPEEAVVRAMKDVPVDATNVQLVAASTIPTDRTFRDAWKADTGAVVVDMPKARALHLDRIRVARQPLLVKLDADWMKALGQKKTGEADAIEAQRQTLRDLPATVKVAEATTPEDLKQLWPASLARED